MGLRVKRGNAMTLGLKHYSAPVEDVNAEHIKGRSRKQTDRHYMRLAEAEA